MEIYRLIKKVKFTTAFVFFILPGKLRIYIKLFMCSILFEAIILPQNLYISPRNPITMAEKGDVEINIDVLKKNWKIILLAIIVIFGLYLRWYHVDYPVIGYHNWKETHYLTEARNFEKEGFFAHGFLVPAHDFPNLNADPSGAHSEVVPTYSILLGIIFKLTGPSLAVARTVNILFSLATIIILYLLTKELFSREDIALTAAFLAALNPLSVFFSHNVDMMIPGTFFMLLCAYYYIRWLKTDADKLLIYSIIFFVLAAITKYTFAFIAIPIILTLPYKKITERLKKADKTILTAIGIGALLPLQYFYSLKVGKATGSPVVTGKLIDLGYIFSENFKAAIISYIKDNYTMLGFVFAILGIILFFVFYKKDIGYKFARGYIIALPIFIILLSRKLGGHSYHQFPMAPLIIMMMAFFIVVAANNLKGFVKFSYAAPIAIAALLFLLYSPSMEARDRQFNTQFPGLDIAGEYIKEHSEEDERMFFSGEQSYGVLWHADRKGYPVHPNETEVKFAEENYNVRWVLFYLWGLNAMQDPAKFDYIKQTYSLKQIGIVQVQNGYQPYYMLFEKGGSFDPNALQNMTAGKPVQTKNYEYTFREYPFSYINIG